MRLIFGAALMVLLLGGCSALTPDLNGSLSCSSGFVATFGATAVTTPAVTAGPKRTP